MTRVLDTIARRLKRIDEHLAALDEERSIFLDNARRSVLRRFEPHASQYVFYVEGQPPLEWEISISEVTHHLRSALDNLISGLVEHRHATVTKWTAFPIATKPEWWSDTAVPRYLAGLTSDDIEIIKSFQPFKRSHGDTDNDPLVRLGWLSNRDKHRIPHAVFAATQSAFPLPEKIPAVPVATNCIVLAFALGGAGEPHAPYTDIAWVTVAPTGPDHQVDMKGDLQLQVSLTDGEHSLVFDDLHEIRADAERIVVALTPQFA